MHLSGFTIYMSGKREEKQVSVANQFKCYPFICARRAPQPGGRCSLKEKHRYAARTQVSLERLFVHALSSVLPSVDREIGMEQSWRYSALLAAVLVACLLIPPSAADIHTGPSTLAPSVVYTAIDYALDHYKGFVFPGKVLTMWRHDSLYCLCFPLTLCYFRETYTASI